MDLNLKNKQTWNIQESIHPQRHYINENLPEIPYKLFSEIYYNFSIKIYTPLKSLFFVQKMNMIIFKKS